MRILIAEDDSAIRKGIEAFLTSKGYDVESTGDGQAALDACIKNPPDLIISDVKMPRMTGLELLEKIKAKELKVPVLIMTAFASLENAVRAMKQGAEDYLPKPLNLEELQLKVEKIQKRQSLLNENLSLRNRINKLEFPEIIGVSKKLKEAFRIAASAAEDPDVPVMIYGGSGTGKELAARNIHKLSARADNPFIAVNCAAIPDSLLESELFGYRKGAFTGAYQNKDGVIKAAQKGTLFLDEVSEMSPRLQALLLRVLQEKTLQPLGSTELYKLDIRVIGASNRNLREMMETQEFREDLFYRLNVVEILLPPLRERREDIPLLIDHFKQIYGNDSPEGQFAAETIDILQNYQWPGNIRELENLVRMLLVTCKDRTISAAGLPKYITEKSPSHLWNETINQSSLKSALASLTRNFEQDFIKKYLEKNSGNISRTADEIGLSRVALHKKIKEYKISIE